MTATKTVVAPENLEQYRADLRRIVKEAAQEAVTEQRASAEAAEAKLRERLDAIDARVNAIADARAALDVPGALGGRDEHYSLGRVADACVAALSRGAAAFEDIAPYELRVSNEAREKQRAQGTTPDDKGGFLVPTEVHNELIIKPLKDRLMLAQLGVQQMTATTGVFEVPTVEKDIDEHAGANENEAVPEGEAKFGMKEARPNDLGVFLKASRRFLGMGVNADNILRDMIVREQARRLSRWGIKGRGKPFKEPVGLLLTSGIGTQTFSGVSATAPTEPLYQGMLKMEEKLRLAEAFDEAESLSWLMPVKFLRVLRSLKDENASAGTASGSFARKIISSGADERVLGHAWRTWTALLDTATAELIFGDWARLWQINWGGMTIEASNIPGMRERQTHIVAWSTHDFMCEQPTAFAIATGLDLSGL